MSDSVDLLFILNVPAFYKINLLNKLSETCKVHAFFIGLTNQVIINNEFSKTLKFSFDLVFDGIIEERIKKNVFLNVYSKLKEINPRYIIWGGWDIPELWPLIFIQPQHRNCIICESSIYDSSYSGIKGFIKRILVKRIAHAFVSGEPHLALFKSLGFKGKVHLTGGVGLFPKQKCLGSNEHNPLNFIYVGRLIEKKNIEILISVFNKNNKPLAIAGAGDLEQRLKEIANENIKFLGFIENDRLSELYSAYDCLILPSRIEQWGLVVEEALYYGLPVIVSDRVGCNIDMVRNYCSGVVFDFSSEVALICAINSIESQYKYYKDNVMTIDFKERDINQIESFLKIL